MGQGVSSKQGRGVECVVWRRVRKGGRREEELGSRRRRSGRRGTGKREWCVYQVIRASCCCEFLLRKFPRKSSRLEPCEEKTRLLTRQFVSSFPKWPVFPQRHADAFFKVWGEERIYPVLYNIFWKETSTATSLISFDIYSIWTSLCDHPVFVSTEWGFILDKHINTSI